MQKVVMLVGALLSLPFLGAFPAILASGATQVSAPGDYAGTFNHSAGQDADLYAVTVPTNTSLLVSGGTSGYFDDYAVEIIDADTGITLGSAAYDWFDGVGDQHFATGAHASGGHYLIRMSDGANPGFGAYGYTLSLGTELAPDLRITSMRIVEPPLTVQGAPPGVGPSVARYVSVDLANVGFGVAKDATLSLWVTHPDQGGQRDLPTTTFSLAPGANTTITVPWDATGELGDATVHALAQETLPIDVDASDNAASLDASVLVGNSGHGVDPLNLDLGFVQTRYGATVKGVTIDGITLGIGGSSNIVLA
jgi:hypothetical protein